MSEEKKTHKEAGYRTRTLYATRYCGNCSMFRDRAKDRCTLVVDPIDHDGWCRFYSPDDEERSAA
jgi:hypothetical protein